MLKLLIVEDDEKISESIATFLKEDFEITQVYDGDEGLFEIESGIYDCVILDWMLPERSGIEILKETRSENNKIPVLMLTAKDDLGDKMKGFSTGVDDYLTKPFYLEELKMRIFSLLKRVGKMESDSKMIYGNLEIDLSNHIVLSNGEEKEVLGKEFELLVYLIQNQGVILTKEQIFDRIWGFESETVITVVEVYMSKLRKHLKGTSLEEHLKTLRNVGYILKKERSE